MIDSCYFLVDTFVMVDTMYSVLYELLISQLIINSNSLLIICFEVSNDVLNFKRVF